MKNVEKASLELLNPAPLEMEADAVLGDFIHYYCRTLGQRRLRPGSPYPLKAVVQVVRDRLTERRIQTQRASEAAEHRRAFYLSLEYLMGRLLRNALNSLDLTPQSAGAMERLGLDLEEIEERELDAGLGNGGLGRLAACFLDSCATLALPVTGYGIRYQYGMFHQFIENGYQVEEPDSWLRDGFPWEIERFERSRIVRFGGHTSRHQESSGRIQHEWLDTHDVLAIPYDVHIPGYRNGVVNTLRLWSASTTDVFDLEEFNAGSYSRAVETKNEAENITMVLYPNTPTESGHELRLRQQYFLASASLQDVLHGWVERNDEDFSQFANKNRFQLNDTHPSIAVAELMRILMDDHGLGWNEAWDITQSTMAYTNHTLLPEALETWPVAMMSRLLPRLMEIIFEINARFLSEVSLRWPGDNERMRRMSLIEEGPEPRVRMAYLAIVGSFSVNGVAELHSRLLREGLFRDFAELWPGKFNNKTNGVTQRRWLSACNPALARLIDDRIGSGWVTDLERLEELKPHADDAGFREAWRGVRQANKIRLSDDLRRRAGVSLDPAMLYDVQVKRIHEYKRQVLNVLHVVHLYDRIRRGDGDDLAPRAVIFGGKAAPGYVMAKNIIKFINNVAAVVNSDPATYGRLCVAFYPDYNVSAMERICTAADLSEQISTAGKEASGTGNMKLMMNGAVTVGTLDGANVEILEAVGEEHFFLFGLTVEEVQEVRRNYDPAAVVEADEDLSRVMRLLGSGHFNRLEPGVLDAVIRSVTDPNDPWMTAADFRSFVDAHARAEAAWADREHWMRMSILNTASSGRFSTDRTIGDYNRDIWRLEPLKIRTA